MAEMSLEEFTSTPTINSPPPPAKSDSTLLSYEDFAGTPPVEKKEESPLLKSLTGSGTKEEYFSALKSRLSKLGHPIDTINEVVDELKKVPAQLREQAKASHQPSKPMSDEQVAQWTGELMNWMPITPGAKIGNVLKDVLKGVVNKAEPAAANAMGKAVSPLVQGIDHQFGIKTDAEREVLRAKRLDEVRAAFGEDNHGVASWLRDDTELRLAETPRPRPANPKEASEVVAKYMDQSGKINQTLINRLAAAGMGAAAGPFLYPDDPVKGAVYVGLAGLAVGGVKPTAIKEVFQKTFAKDTRIRVDELANQHDYEIGATARAIWQKQNELEKLVPDVERRNAITHWLEGNQSIPLSKEELKAAELSRDFFNDVKARGMATGVLKTSLDNYVTHLWNFGTQSKSKIAEAMENRGSGPSMSPNSRFAKERSIPTIAEGKRMGLTPLTEDISQIIGIYGNSMARSMANREMINALKAAQTPAGQKLLLAADDAPHTYTNIPHPQLAGYRVHPDIAPSMKFIFDHSDPNVITRGLLGLNVAAKRSLVSFSMFHAKALTDAFISAGGNPTKVIGFAKGTDQYLKMMREGGAGDLVDTAIKGGLKFSLEHTTPAVEDVGGTFYGAMKDLQSLADKVVPGSGKPVDWMIKANHQVDKFMWARLHAGMKLNIFAKEYERLTLKNAAEHAKNPSIPLTDKEKIAADVASYTNDLFGGLNWRRIAEESKTKIARDIKLAAYSPSGRRAMQFLIFAPDWTISTTRAAAKAFGGGIKGNDLSVLHRRYVAGAAAYYMTVGNAINMAMSGHFIWDNKPKASNKNPTMLDKLDAMTTLDMGDGRTMQWSKHTMEPVHWLLKPGQQSLNKFGLPIKEPLAQLMGVEYLSSSGHMPPIKSRLGHLAKNFEPIAVQQAFDQDVMGAKGIAGFFGAPIYGETETEKADRKLKKRMERALKMP